MMVSSNDFAQQNALEKNPCARISYDNDNNNNNIDNNIATEIQKICMLGSARILRKLFSL